jgi:hypothetical protein
VLQGVENRRALTGFFAKDSQTLRDGIGLLRTKGFWRALSGAAVVIDTAEQSMRVEPGPDEGEELRDSRQPKLDWRVGMAFAMASLALLALLVAFMVRRRIQSRNSRAKRASRGN